MKSERWAAMLCAILLCAPACGVAQEPQAIQQSSAPGSRQLGSWKGTGNTTLGFVSESGSFRTTWTTRNQDPAMPGSFQLTLRSGISGRPIKVIAEHHGAGSGSEEFGTIRVCTSSSWSPAASSGLFRWRKRSHLAANERRRICRAMSRRSGDDHKSVVQTWRV